MSIEYVDYFGANEPVVEEKLIDVVDEETVDAVDETPTMMGVIYNAQKVYMRVAPDKESNHLAILDKGEEVMIDGTAEDALGNGWYHLITASGKEGYTMSEFVKIVE